MYSLSARGGSGSVNIEREGRTRQHSTMKRKRLRRKIKEISVLSEYAHWTMSKLWQRWKQFVLRALASALVSSSCMGHSILRPCEGQVPDVSLSQII